MRESSLSILFYIIITFPLIFYSMHQYMLINKIGEGAFSEVLKSQSIKSGITVAIKCMKNQY